MGGNRDTSSGKLRIRGLKPGLVPRSSLEKPCSDQIKKVTDGHSRARALRGHRLKKQGRPAAGVSKLLRAEDLEAAS